MQGGHSILSKVRFYSSVGVYYALTLLFACYLYHPFSLFSHKSQVVYSQALAQQAVTSPTARPIISGKPVRIVIAEADNGLDIDLPIDEGNYDAKSNSWTLGDQHAYFATPSVVANDTRGNTFIYGHNMQNVFGYLSAIHQNVGAYAQIYTDNGHVFRYSYQDAENLKPDDLSVFQYDGPPRLTVQTCSGSWFEWRRMYHFSFEKMES